MRLPYRSGTPQVAAELRSSLPFCWLADDGLDARSGQPGTFGRTSAGGYWVDGHRGFWPSVHSQPRWETVVHPVTGRTHRGLLLEPARANKVLHSEDFGAWTAVGTPTRVASARRVGDAVLDLIGDDASGALEGYSQQLQAFDDNGTKGISLLVAPGTSTSTVLRVRVTAGADVLRAAITWSAGVPQVSMQTGTFVGRRALAAGVWELRWLTTSVTAANSHDVLLYPATDLSLATTATGTVYCGAVCALNRHSPLSLIRNAGSVISAGAESLTWPWAVARAVGRRFWLYLAFTELGSRYVVGAAGGYCAVGDPLPTGTGLAIYPNSFVPGLAGLLWVGGAGGIAGVAAWPAFGDFVEALLTVTPAGVPTLEVAFNGVSQGTGTGGAVTDESTAWTTAVVRLGAFGPTAGYQAGGAVYHALKLGYGTTPSLAQARGYS